MGECNYERGTHARGNAHAQLEDVTEILDGIEDEVDGSGRGWHCLQLRFDEIDALYRAKVIPRIAEPSKSSDSSQKPEKLSDRREGTLAGWSRDLPIGASMEDLP
ncbi:hypothetical protein [Rhodococcus ruber]|uniref:hypothetical protein n=1 Tax=Rhodococcus ruber TaxID=1830 RepID=UPI00315D5E7E